MKERTFIFVDTETTGLLFGFHEVIEIGAVRAHFERDLFGKEVFVKIDEEKKWDLKKINGIINFVYWLGKPAVIKEQEIITIRKFLNEFSDVQVAEERGLKVNAKVRIKQGLMMNYQGLLIGGAPPPVCLPHSSIGGNLAPQ